MSANNPRQGGGLYQDIKHVLADNDPVFASLEQEKKLGWESKDVERLWKLRTEKLNLLSESRKGKDHKKTPQLAENPFGALLNDREDDDEDEDPTKNLSVTGQKLIRAGKGPSYDKYYDFYRKLFTAATEHSAVFSIGHKRFIDIGCAPGGLCAYFVRDLGWSGVGFTLQLERGGLKVRFKDPNLRVHHCDMSDMDSVDLISQAVGGAGKYDFINCGVVMGKHQVESIGEDRETALQILRVNRNQFLAALKWLAHGGDLFWVFQSSSVGSWFYFLSRLQKCFTRKISLYSTLVPSRSPVYAICSGFDANCAATKAWINELETTVEFGDEQLDSWNMTSWEEAGPLIASLRTDLYRIWGTQRDGLREIREAASQQLEKEESLLKKLSGSRQDGEASSTVPTGSPLSSFTARKPRSGAELAKSDFDGDWRRGTPKDDDGWEQSKPTRQSNRNNSNNNRQQRNNGGSSHASSRADVEASDSWRR